jgi:hypothetical protein
MDNKVGFRSPSLKPALFDAIHRSWRWIMLGVSPADQAFSSQQQGRSAFPQEKTAASVDVIGYCLRCDAAFLINNILSKSM